MFQERSLRPRGASTPLSHTLAFVGVLIIRRSPGLVVVEGCAALTTGASSVVLADTGIMDLGEGPSVIRKDSQRNGPDGPALPL